MRRQRREEWASDRQREDENHIQWQSPPPNRVAASPYINNNNNDHNHNHNYNNNSIDDGSCSVHSFNSHDSNNNSGSGNGTPSKDMKHRRNNSNNSDQLLRRSSSFGDAEDYLNTMITTSGLADVGYYQSFVMESPPTSKILNGDAGGNLHHRHNHAAAAADEHDMNNNNNNDYDDESPQHKQMRQRAFLSPFHNKHHAIQQLHKDHHPSGSLSLSLSSNNRLAAWAMRSSSTRVARWCLGMGLSFYLILLFRSTYFIGTDSLDEDSYFQFGPDHNRYISYKNHQQRNTRGYAYNYYYNTYNNKPSTTIPQWYAEQIRISEDARIKQETQKSQRNRRTKPPTPSSSYISSLFASPEEEVRQEWHHISPLDERQQQQQRQSLSTSHDDDEDDDDELASIDDLCGYSAQNSALNTPQKYPSRAALNADSRVVITGILNPIGISLALRLKQHCGVQHIAGVDTMFPNTVLNRLLVQERIQLLTTNIPKLSKQIYLPYFGLDPKLKTKKNNNNGDSNKKSLDDEMLWMQDFEPTHVVHLSSYSMDVMYNDALIDPNWKNIRSPYISEEVTSSSQSTSSNVVDHQQPYFYPIRTGMVSMEQILQTVSSFPEKERPQLLYATTANGNSVNKASTNTHDTLFQTMKQMDEVLADTYHTRYDHQLPSIGLRLPNAIYGPWGYAGSIMHDMMQQAVEEQQQPQSASSSTRSSSTTNLDLLYVDDAVDAIISALQHRPDAPTTVTVSPETTASMESIASAIQSVLSNGSNNTNNARPISEDENANPPPPVNGNRRRLKMKNAKNFRRFNSNSNKKTVMLSTSDPQTPLKDGLLKSVAWHLDRLAPYGPAPTETGDELLKRHDKKTCGPFDINCHKSNDYLPCNSECNIHEKCLPSIFDDTRELMYNVSEGCDIVLYTQSLGYNVEDMELHAEYMDDKDLDDDELLVCNFAVVPRESDLVSLVANKVPNDQLAKFGIEPQPSDRSSKDMRERKLDGLNGRLLYRGWILIWVKEGMHDLTAPNASLLKLSPSKFFHPTVNYGLYVEDNFKVSPNLDDVLFLADEMKRRKLSDRSLKKEESIETPHGTITKKVKYRIPQEPARQAAILFAPLRYPNIDDPIIEQYRAGRRKLTVYDASKFMQYEVGYEQDEKASPSLRRQREYYERIPSYINKNDELRSNSEPWYRYSMRHWVRSRWVLHDFTLEESRLLRCDWYQEHVQWGNDLDQLSFANVMAVRELKRRIAHQEPDDHVKTFIETNPELHDLTDSYEWHSMETEVNKFYREPIDWKSQQPAPVQVMIDANGELQAQSEDLISEEGTPSYVRIMSERVMGASRRIWARKRKKLTEAKKSQE
jgi:nucleoside-diphosphate-sugar epimerase